MIWFFVLTQVVVVLVLRTMFQVVWLIVLIIASTISTLAGSTHRAWRRRREVQG